MPVYETAARSEHCDVNGSDAACVDGVPAVYALCSMLLGQHFMPRETLRELNDVYETDYDPTPLELGNVYGADKMRSVWQHSCQVM